MQVRVAELDLERSIQRFNMNNSRGTLSAESHTCCERACGPCLTSWHHSPQLRLHVKFYIDLAFEMWPWGRVAGIDPLMSLLLTNCTAPLTPHGWQFSSARWQR